MVATVIQTRVDAKLKKEAEAVLNSLGLSIQDAMRIFLHQVTLKRGIPFALTIDDSDEVPNAKTRAAMENVLEGKNLLRFSSTKEFMDWLGE